MKKIYLSLVIILSVVFFYFQADKDIPVIKPNSVVNRVVENTQFQSYPSSDHEEIVESIKDEVEQSVSIKKNNKKEKKQNLDVRIETCDRDCLEQIKQKFYNNIQNREVIDAILQEIFTQNSPELLEFLFEIIVLANDTDNLELINDINLHIREVKSKEVLISLIESLLKNKDSGYAYSNFPTSTRQAITHVINERKDRENIIPVLEHVYFSDKKLIQEFLPDLDYPELFSLVALRASEVGDISLQEDSVEKLINNYSDYSVPAIYLYAEKNTSSTAVADAFYLAKEWGSRHINPKSLGIAEAYLHGHQASTAARIASIGILSNMDDKEKLSGILSKVRLHSEDSIVDLYIDELLLKLAEP